MSAGTILILITAVLWIAYLFYWAVVRPYIIETVEDDLSKLRAELDWAIIDGIDGSQTQAAQALVTMFDVKVFLGFVSISHILFCSEASSAGVQAEAARYREIFHGAPDWIQEMRARYMNMRLKAILANSPICWVPIAFVLLVAVFSKKVSRWWNDVVQAVLVRPPDRSYRGMQHA